MAPALFRKPEPRGIFGITVPRRDRARSTLPVGRVDFRSAVSGYIHSENASGRQPVSRILSRTAIPLGGALLRALQRPTRRFPPCLAYAQHVTRVGAPGRHASAADRAGLRISSLFGLAPCGVYHASAVTAGAVRSYRTFSPLPPSLTKRWRYILCGTCRLAALTPRSRTLSGTLPCGVRTFLSRLGLRLAGSGRPACLHSSYVSSV
jgi:hypothetical protein